MPDAENAHIIPAPEHGFAPADRFDAWTEAETAALRVLCDATGHTPGTDAFLGERERHATVANAFYLYNDPVQYAGEVFYAPRPGSLALKYTAVGTFLARRDAQRWACRIIDALPVQGVGNVQVFRLDDSGIGALKVQPVAFGSEPDEREAYVLPLTFDLVFNLR